MNTPYPVDVTLVSLNPIEFSFNPDHHEIPKGTQQVVWRAKGGMPFKFVAVAFCEANQFSNVVVDTKNNEITAVDDNHAPETDPHLYSVVVKADVDGYYYNSRDGKRPKPTSDGPTIRNK